MVKSRPARTSASGSDLTRFPDCDGMAELVRTGHCHADRQEWEPAVALLREGIAALRQSPMEEQVKQQQIAQLEKNLALCEAKLQAPATV